MDYRQRKRGILSVGIGEFYNSFKVPDGVGNERESYPREGSTDLLIILPRRKSTKTTLFLSGGESTCKGKLPGGGGGARLSRANSYVMSKRKGHLIQK